MPSRFLRGLNRSDIPAPSKPLDSDGDFSQVERRIQNPTPACFRQFPVIYNWVQADGQIFLLFAYAKNERANLTGKEARQLRENAGL